MGLFDSMFGAKKDVASTQEVESRLKAESVRADSAGEGTFRVDDVYHITGVGFVPVGEVMSGKIMPGFRCENQGNAYEIKTIEAHHQQLKEAAQGEKVGMNLKGVKDRNELPKGTVLSFRR